VIARVATALAAAGLLAGCAAMPWSRAADEPWPWQESRAQYLRRAHVWLGKDLDSWVTHVRTLDLVAGPPGRDAFEPEELVRCAYVEPTPKHPVGRTPKFFCEYDRPDPDVVLKVKWGADNGEVFAEVASTRLLWALGFPVDRMYPVQVECRGCPEDPWRGHGAEPGSTRPFAPAIIELPFAGRTIEEHDDQGWKWTELADIDPAAGGAPRAHVDALRLLAAFLQHRDSKPENQRLLCAPGDVVKARGGRRESCRAPLLMIDDLGSTFGGPAKVFTHKMALESWRETSVWENPRRCIANLTGEFAATGGLERPAIGEEGRRFLSTLLDALDDRQLAALFRVARADERGGVAEWVAAFRKHRDAVRRPVPSEPGFRCPG
jgi:hypothetical protein